MLRLTVLVNEQDEEHLESPSIDFRILPGENKLES